MRLIVYADEKDALVDGFLAQAASWNDAASCRRFTTVENMLGALKEPIAERMVFVFFINKIEELILIKSDKDLFRSNPVLLVLADANEDTINLSHRIGARYIGDDQTDPVILGQIVLRIFKKNRKPEELDEESQAEEAIHRC